MPQGKRSIWVLVVLQKAAGRENYVGSSEMVFFPPEFSIRPRCSLSGSSFLMVYLPLYGEDSANVIYLEVGH